MGWSLGEHDGRDIGYGVPALCDHPNCVAKIDRGLAYVCGGDAYGGDVGCGLFFCEEHRSYSRKRASNGERVTKSLCKRCRRGMPSFDPKPDVAEWLHFKAKHPSWAEWRREQAARGRTA